MRYLLSRASALAALAVVFFLAVCPGNALADDLFVANWGSGTIGQYTTTSGATMNSSLIFLGSSWGIAASGSDLFVTDGAGGTIGEYTTSGVAVNPSLVSGLQFPLYIQCVGSDLFK
jgi:hypothetical protein